jgi:hypothetical protein
MKEMTPTFQLAFLTKRGLCNIFFHMLPPLLRMEVLNQEDALEVAAKGFVNINQV